MENSVVIDSLKRWCIVLAIMFFSVLGRNCIGQNLGFRTTNGILFGEVTEGINSYQSIFDIDGSVFIDYRPVTIRKDSWYLILGTGLGLQTLTYDKDSFRIVHTYFPITLEANFIKIIGDSYEDEFYLILSLGTDINTSYSLSTYKNNRIRKRNLLDEYRERSLQSINRFSPYLRVSFGPSNRIAIYGKYYLDSFFRANQGISADISANRIALGINWIIMRTE